MTKTHMNLRVYGHIGVVEAKIIASNNKNDPTKHFLAGAAFARLDENYYQEYMTRKEYKATKAYLRALYDGMIY